MDIEVYIVKYIVIDFYVHITIRNILLFIITQYTLFMSSDLITYIEKVRIMNKKKNITDNDEIRISSCTGWALADAFKRAYSQKDKPELYEHIQSLIDTLDQKSS